MDLCKACVDGCLGAGQHVGGEGGDVGVSDGVALEACGSSSSPDISAAVGSFARDDSNVLVQGSTAGALPAVLAAGAAACVITDVQLLMYSCATA
jgi:hypothetical protein